ncbi:hypothetical protein C8R43DRAFT_907411 [Mycena crocata]|nr:hypothetical protein C8R43DRAFT_907411 [Mycena crocata]
MTSTAASGSRIHLRVANKRAYVWDVEGSHRLCGVFTGTLPHLSQQNLFLGVPQVLMPEEVVLLVENELAVLVDDPKAHLQPSIRLVTSLLRNLTRGEHGCRRQTGTSNKTW